MVEEGVHVWEESVANRHCRAGRVGDGCPAIGLLGNGGEDVVVSVEGELQMLMGELSRLSEEVGIRRGEVRMLRVASSGRKVPYQCFHGSRRSRLKLVLISRRRMVGTDVDTEHRNTKHGKAQCLRD